MITNLIFTPIMLAIWCCIIQPIHIVQYVFKLLYLNPVAKIIGLLAWPFCYLVFVLDAIRDVLGGIDLPISEALSLRAKYHMRGGDSEIRSNSNIFSKGLSGQCYYDDGNFVMAKKKMLDGFCIFSYILYLTHAGHRKKVSEYLSNITRLYAAKKYDEVVNFYEGNPEKKKYAGIIGTKNYIYSLWYSGKTEKAMKLIPSNNKLYDELRAMDYEKKGKLKEAAKYYHSANKEEDEARVLNIIDDNQRAVLRNIADCYKKQDYKKVIELFENNSFITDRKDADETIGQYVSSVHATSGVSQTLVSVIERFPNTKNVDWERWQAEYYNSLDQFLEAAKYYKAANMMDDYQRMLDKEEERKRIEEEKRIAREIEKARECETKGQFLESAKHYKAANLMEDYQRMLDKEEERKRIEEEQRKARELEEANALEASGDFKAAAVKFKALNLTADYERVNKKEHDRKIARLKEKMNAAYKDEKYGDVIKDVEANEELLEDIEIVDCYLWSLWMHDGTEKKAVELVDVYAKKFNTTKWECILGHYYKWGKDYQDAIKHYRIAGMDEEIKKIEDIIRKNEEEERRRQEEEERQRQEEERRRKEHDEAMDKFQEYISIALKELDTDYCDKALEYAHKAGEDDYETTSAVENIKKAIESLMENEYAAAKTYFRKAGLPQWADQIDKELEEQGYEYYSSDRGSGCSECTNACAGSCGRSCSNSCGGSCTSSCGGACSVGRNKRKN